MLVASKPQATSSGRRGASVGGVGEGVDGGSWVPGAATGGATGLSTMSVTVRSMRVTTFDNVPRGERENAQVEPQ